jgi:hypothetical protein
VFSLSVRREYEHRRQGREPLCRLCRRPERPPPDDRDREFWLQRFPLEELVAIADAIWGPRA